MLLSILLMIDYDGSVLLCNMIGIKKILGNINNESILTIWQK